MKKKVFVIAMAYFSTTVGAGFASGQEALQYYVSYGWWGIIGAAVGLILAPLIAMVILQYGSYFRAQSHREVFGSVTSKWMAKFLDYSLAISQFCLAFVMLAGAGSNLNQQFGVPLWVGSVIMVVMVVLIGLLNATRVTNIMGSITPLMVIILIGVAIWTVASPPESLSGINEYALNEVASPLPNWWLSTLNYIGLALFSSVSMALIIGGTNWNSRVAGWGGFFGGILFAGIMFLMVLALFFRVEDVADRGLPTLALVNEVSPQIGFVAAIMTYLMIFTTALGLLYSLGKRVAVAAPNRYPAIFIVLTLAAFGLSFFDFATLVSVVFPILGWLGILLVGVLLVTWIARGRRRIGQEVLRRDKVRSLILKSLDPKGKFTNRDRQDLEAELDQSNIEGDDLRGDITREAESDNNKPRSVNEESM